MCRTVEAGEASALDEIAAAAVRSGLGDREITRTISSARRGIERRTDRQPDREATR